LIKDIAGMILNPANIEKIKMKNIPSPGIYFSKMKQLFICIIFILGNYLANAHQTPGTIVLLDVSPAKVAVELQLPLSELELAFGQDVFKNADNLVQRLGPQIKEYLLAHIHVMEAKDKPWLVEVTDMKVEKAEQAASGPPFKEITVHLMLTPYPGATTRKFIFDYDVIMHQVMNHAAFVSIRNDWETGKADGHLVEAGVIHRDMKDNVIYPLEINLEKGSWWKGFKSMLALGMQHIKEGTDHLLFLLVLLLPAMLLVNGKSWGRFGGIKYSITRLLKIVTAFTIGHSITLLIGALGWLKLPAQPVEILIAISILVSAIHAIYPIFPGREMYVAAGFGLIHGLAFASVLANLNLAAGAMAVSILGFNLGIESMQLFVVIIIMPWLVLLSQTRWYKYIRVTGASLAGVAALAWIAERVSGDTNTIGVAVQKFSLYAVWGIAGLAFFSLVIYLLDKKSVTYLIKRNNAKV
jgi:HupE / UreJ protein